LKKHWKPTEARSKIIDMEYDPTKSNYETANDWHAEKSELYNWSPQLDAFLQFANVKPEKVLDAGSGGSGRDIRQFRQRGIVVEGLDYSHAAVEKLKQQFPDGKFYEVDLRSTSLPVENYDGVWACASLLNLKKSEVPAALSEFKRILKPKGKLFVSVKEGQGERMIPDKAGERLFSFYSEDEIRKIVETAGFQIDHSEVMEDTFTNAAPKTLPRWISVYAIKT